MLLALANLAVTRRNRPVLRGIDLTLQEGEVVGLIGPNGAGKSTLMEAALDLIPFSGASSLASMTARDRARAAAFLPQSREIAWPVSVEDLFALGVVLIVFFAIVGFMPNYLGHPDNYIEANPLVTPPEIVPEWYFLPFYAILRAFTSDVWVVQLVNFLSFRIIDAKFFGVLAMFGSILVLALVPWLDTSRVRSGRYRPQFKWWFWMLAADFVILTWVGARPTEGIYPLIALAGAAYWFAYFLIILPLLGVIEKPDPMPATIEEDFLAHHESPTRMAE
jgi:ubiquinol-cytochrome c reductase cytochrome b subunit